MGSVGKWTNLPPHASLGTSAVLAKLDRCDEEGQRVTANLLVDTLSLPILKLV